MIISKATAILSLVPGAGVTVYGQDINAEVLWINPTEAPVTTEQIAAEMIRLQEEYDANKYQRLRAPEYPPMTDYLDAVYWQAQGDDSKMTAYLAAVEAVKSKFPKGDQ